MVDILRAIQEVRNPEEAEDREENEPSNEAKDTRNEMRRTPHTILHSGLHLSSLAVGDGHRVFSKANRCSYESWLSLNHGGGDLLLLLGLRGRRTLRGDKGERFPDNRRFPGSEIDS